MIENVLVTGSSSGIGRAVAELFLEVGYRVYGLDKDLGTIDDENYYHFVHDFYYQGPPELPEMSYIINNVGTDDPYYAIATNLESAFQVEDLYLTSKTKCVINICSTSAHLGIENREYVASKGALLSYTRQLAKRMSAWGGRCNSVSPGPVYTAMTKSIYEDTRLAKMVADQNILHRWIDPKEIAESVWFLCDAPGITGIDILIDCGEHINHQEIKVTD